MILPSSSSISGSTSGRHQPTVELEVPKSMPRARAAVLGFMARNGPGKKRPRSVCESVADFTAGDRQEASWDVRAGRPDLCIRICQGACAWCYVGAAFPLRLAVLSWISPCIEPHTMSCVRCFARCWTPPVATTPLPCSIPCRRVSPPTSASSAASSAVRWLPCRSWRRRTSP